MILESVSVGELEVNCYIVAASKDREALIIDPGDDEAKIKKVLHKHGLKPGLVINTHSHYDHIGCDDKFGVAVYAHRLDAGALKNPQGNLSALFMRSYRVESEIREVEEGDIISCDGVELEVIHTPGHTPGGICLLMKKPQGDILFSGDTLFYRGVGRADLPGGNEEVLISAIREKLFILPDQTAVYPGHGPSSSIGMEKQSNPFFS